MLLRLPFIIILSPHATQQMTDNLLHNLEPDSMYTNVKFSNIFNITLDELLEEFHDNASTGEQPIAYVSVCVRACCVYAGRSVTVREGWGEGGCVGLFTAGAPSRPAPAEWARRGGAGPPPPRPRPRQRRRT